MADDKEVFAGIAPSTIGYSTLKFPATRKKLRVQLAGVRKSGGDADLIESPEGRGARRRRRPARTASSTQLLQRLAATQLPELILLRPWTTSPCFPTNAAYIRIGNDAYGCPSSYQGYRSSYGKSDFSFGMYFAQSEKTTYQFNWARNILLGSGTRPNMQVQMINQVRDSSNAIWMADATFDRSSYLARGEGQLQLAQFTATNWTSPLVKFGARTFLVHDNAANVMFYDGHVERMAKEQMFATKTKVNNFFTSTMARIELP